MIRTVAPGDMAAIEAGPYGLSLAAASACVRCGAPNFAFIGPSAANSFSPLCRFHSGTYHSAHHLARHLSAVLAQFAPWVPSLDLIALP
jgi:hypothetical protein